MKSHIPVARRVGAIQRHQAPAGRNFHEESGGNRTEWWWEDGPVDTCCGCCTLRTGVGLLAASDLVMGMITLVFLSTIYELGFDFSLGLLKDKYSRDCTDRGVLTVDCEELMEAIKQMEGSFNLYVVLLQVQGLIRLAAGMVGLSAVSYENAQSARLYMLVWPANFFFGLLMTLTRTWSAKGNPADQGEVFLLLKIVVHTAILAYYFKVSWSYYKIRLDHESARSNIIPWNAMHQEQPMTTMPIA